MSKWNEFTKNLDKIESLYLTEYDFILAAFLSNELILKRMIKESSPEITDKQLDEIVKPEEELIAENDLEGDELPIEGEDELPPDVVEEKKRKRREEYKARIAEIKKIWKNRLIKMLDEIKKKVRDLKKSIIDLVENSKQLANKLITSATLIASSIPSIAITIAAPPWNIPAALVEIAIILTLYFDILLLLKVSASLMAPLRDLPLYIDPVKLGGLASVLNVYLIGVIAAWAPIMLLKKIITNLIEGVKKFLFDNKRRIFRKATRRLRKLKYLPDVNMDNVSDDDIDEVNDILERFKIGDKKVIDFKENFDNQFNELESRIDSEISVDIGDISDLSDLERFVYDVELPDGTIITSLNEEGVAYFKEKYNFTIVDAE